ncbi:hypothetical protein FS837_003462, partial [Tulasnella sp. UAMH 9824]
MTQPTLAPSNLLLKRKASVDVEEGQEELRNVKRTRICPRAVLEDLTEYRIQPDTIAFNETGTRKQGASADVELATLRLSSFDQITYGGDTMFVAVKKFRLSDDRGDERVLASLAHEISLTSELHHDNVIHLVGFAENIAGNVAWIIHRWEANGNVREFLNSEDWEIPERVSLIYDISCGIKYLHTRNPPIYHGDLKSANILVSSQNRAIITDFGSARYLDKSSHPRARIQRPMSILSDALTEQPNLNTMSPRVNFCSIGTLITLTGTAWTLRWAAPELVMTGNIPFHDETNDIKIALQLATRSFKLPSIVMHEQLSQIQVLCRLINNCWSLDVDGRPTADACLSEIESMIRTIPSDKKEEAIRGMKSIELLDALGQMRLNNGKIDEAMKYFDQELELARSNQRKLGVQGSQIDLGGVHRVRNRHPKAEVTCSLSRVARVSGNRLEGTQATGRLRENPIRQGQYEKIESSYNEAKKAYDRIGNKTGAARTSTRLAEVQILRNNYVNAEALYREAHTIYREIGHQPRIAQLAQALGEVQHLQKDYIKAGASYSEAREIYNSMGNEIGVAQTSMDLGEVLLIQEIYTEAQDSYTRARAVYGRIADRAGFVSATRRLGDVKLAQGEYGDAEASYSKALDVYHEIGDQVGVAGATRRLVDATWRLGDSRLARYEHAKAETSYRRARDIYRGIGDKAGVARATQRLGDVQLIRYDHAKAAALYNEAGDIWHGIADRAGAADATCRPGNVQRTWDEYVKAESSYGKARDIYREIGDWAGATDATRRKADTTRRLGDTQRVWNQNAEAKASYIKARDLYSEIGDQARVADATRGLGDVQQAQAEYVEAEASYITARDFFCEIGDQAGVADAT